MNTLCGIYVDDILLCGQEKSVENDISELKSKFDITVNNEFQDYVGCEIIKEKDTILIHQTKLINKIIREFSTEIKGTEKDTPMSVHEHVIMPDENEEKSMLKRYQHGVGSLLYLVKLSSPDLTKSVR